MSWLSRRAREANSRLAEMPSELKQQFSPVGYYTRATDGPQAQSTARWSREGTQERDEQL